MNKKEGRRSYGASTLLISIGLIMFIAGFGFKYTIDQSRTKLGENIAITPYVAPDLSPELISATPKHLSIPAIEIDIPIVIGEYNESNFTWTLSDTSAVYASISAPVNNTSGNTFIYGHNTKRVFSPLLEIQPGVIAYINGSDGRVYQYELIETKVVSPTDLTVLEQTYFPTLTLQTCSGLWYQHRSIFTFRFIEVI